LKKSKRSRASQQAHPRLAQFPQLARFPMKPLAVVVAMYCSGALAADAADPASGEKIEGPLLHIDDFEVGLRDASGWYRSFSRDRVKVEVNDRLAAHRELLEKLTQADIHNLFAYLQGLK